MGGRDHSWECEVCGQYRGGLNDLECSCTYVDWRGWNLATNLAIAAGLCRAYRLGARSEFGGSPDSDNPWRHGCGRPAPARTP